jgi:hypothetical protein
VYAVQITDDNGCTRLSNGFPVSVNELSASRGINIYPNPVGDQFTVYSLQFTDVAKLEIYNVLGERVSQSEIINQKSEINVAGLAKGVYMVELKNGQKVFRAKFVKE